MNRRILVLLSMLAVVSPALGRERHVPAQYANIQAAIDDCNDGDVVIIAPGTYTGKGNYYISFMGKAITVRGTDPDDPDIVATTAIDATSFPLDNSIPGFMFNSAEDSNSVLAGLTVKGFASDYGINIHGARPLIRNCILSGNYIGINADYLPAEQMDITIEDCLITHNVEGLRIQHAGITVSGCRIAHNAGEGLTYQGSTLWSSDYPLRLEDCSIVGNRGFDGGGISSGRSLIMENCIVAGNYCELNAGAIVFHGELVLRNCTIVGNRTGRDYVMSSDDYGGSGGGGRTYIASSAYPITAEIHNCIITGNYPDSSIMLAYDSGTVDYSLIEGGIDAITRTYPAELEWGPGNIDGDPFFASPGYWDPNGTPDDFNDDFWVDGDYHLRSDSGRWDPVDQTWVRDEVNSVCIDAGDLDDTVGDEPFRNGNRINMGAYGGTGQASKSGFGLPGRCPVFIAGDINSDCKVDFTDLALITADWLTNLDLKATDPSPEDASQAYVGSIAVLAWTAAPGCNSHDLYFGTDAALVADAGRDSPLYIANTANTSYEATQLTMRTVYFWRVDEVYGGSVVKGDVWSFTATILRDPR